MPDLLLLKNPEQSLVFYRNGLIFAFNFSPNNSLTNVLVPVFEEKDYEIALCSDDAKYGGNGLVERITYPSKKFDGQNYIELYLPAKTAFVLKEIKGVKKKSVAAKGKKKV